MDVKRVDDKSIVSHPNYKSDFIIERTNGGNGFWKISNSTNRLSPKLSGFYTSHNKALADLKLFLANSTESQAVKRQYFKDKLREQKDNNAATLQSEDS